jgi:hypothetical protein
MPQVTRRDFIRGIVAAGSVGALAATAAKAPAQQKGVTLRALVYPYPVTKAIRDMLPDTADRRQVAWTGAVLERSPSRWRSWWPTRPP